MPVMGVGMHVCVLFTGCIDTEPLVSVPNRNGLSPAVCVVQSLELVCTGEIT